jgi:hypothetical protein
VLFVQGDPCRNPEIANALAEYCGWIRDEVQSIEESQQRHTTISADLFPLRLPGSERDDRGHPKFIRLDPQFQVEGGWGSSPIRFELSQQDVVKILMGEELYGEPELCLREVIQNALDATHLRWLRYQLRQKLGEATYAKHNLPPADTSLNKDDLEIKVSWGVGNLPEDGWRRDDDDRAPDKRHWIEFDDPGTGMTLDIVQRYFTQIGRSYYQSAEYRRERAMFREYKLPASEISQFGIGILSCFMLADMVEVWTCPIPSTIPSDEDRQPYHFRIWGAHGLFWHQSTKKKMLPGTRIRMWLKKGHETWCEQERIRDELFAKHYSSRLSTEVKHPNRVDPLRAIWASVPWPRYPITFSTDSADSELSDWRLDQTAHLDKLLNLDAKKCHARFEELIGKTRSEPLDFKWAWWDWEHPGTASRIRVALPVADDSLAGSVDSLAGLLTRASDGPHTEFLPAGLLLPWVAESSLPNAGRTQTLVRGIAVPELRDINEQLQFGNHAGSLIMIDLSGHAAPRLRADRKASTSRQRNDWSAEVQRVFADWLDEASSAITGSILHARTAATTISLRRKTWFELAEARISEAVLLSAVVPTPGGQDILRRLLNLDLDRDRDRDRDLHLALARALDQPVAINHETVRAVKSFKHLRCLLQPGRGIWRIVDPITAAGPGPCGGRSRQ